MNGKRHIRKTAKKLLAALLALVMIICASPVVFAESGETGWIVYFEKSDKNKSSVIVVAPANYARVAANPQIETIFTSGNNHKTVSTPSAEQIRFCTNGKTELHWTLTLTYENLEGISPGYGFQIAVLPVSVIDDAGNGNAYVLFDDETAYMSAAGYAEIDIESGLLLRKYSREDTAAAVGDTLQVDYSGLYPVDIFINGDLSATFPGGEMQTYTCDIIETGELNVSVRQRGKVISSRSVTVVESREMYKRNLNEGLITREDIPRIRDLIQVSGPAIIPFIPLAVTIAFFNALSDFFFRWLSFIRIK